MHMEPLHETWTLDLRDDFTNLNARIDHVIAYKRRLGYGYVMHRHESDLNGYDFIISEGHNLNVETYDVANYGTLRLMLRIPRNSTETFIHTARFEAAVAELQAGRGKRLLEIFDEHVPITGDDEAIDLLQDPSADAHDLRNCPFCGARIEYVDHEEMQIYLADGDADSIPLREWDEATTQRSIYRCTGDQHFLGTTQAELEGILRATQLAPS